MLEMSMWNYLIPNIIEKIPNIYENDTEYEHDNVGKFWGKNKWKLLHTETFKCLVRAVSNIDNARNKYVNIERLSRGEVFALLDSIQSDDEEDIEHIMNDSDTEFVAEDESLLISLEKKRSVTKVAQYHFRSINLSTQNEDETNTLGQDEQNCATATQRTFNQSPSSANQRTANQSPAAATQRTFNQSPQARMQRLKEVSQTD